MYVPCILYTLLTQQIMHNIYIYIYINNALYIISTPTCFNASASSSGSLYFYFANITKFSNIVELNKFSR
jgi:hypothetical protein